MKTNAEIVRRLVQAVPLEWVKTPDGFWRGQITPERYDELVAALQEVEAILPETPVGAAS